MYKHALLAMTCLLPVYGQSVVFDIFPDNDRDYDDPNHRYEREYQGRYRNYRSNNYQRYHSGNQWDNRYSSNQRMKDEDVKSAINQIISDFGLQDGGEDLEVRVRNGTVIIEGEVQSRKDRQRLHRMMETLEDLQFVSRVQLTEDAQDFRRQQQNRQNNWNQQNIKNRNNRSQQEDNNQAALYSTQSLLVAEADYQKNRSSDSEIKNKINKELQGGWFSSDYNNVSVNVNDGVVTLTGIVEDEGDLEEIEERLSDIQGVKLIKNNLVLTSSDNRSNRKMSSKHIRKKVEQELNDTWWSTYDDVDVEVHGSTVILKGSVESESDIEDIEERLRTIPGVKVIRSELKIRENGSW